MRDRFQLQDFYSSYIPIFKINSAMNNEAEQYEYHLHLQSVKMRVKFPCKMKIEWNGTLMTGEVAANDDNRFIFNHELVLKDQPGSEYFQLAANLTTDKGHKYSAGFIKVFANELIHSQGQKISIVLTRCIDNEAFAQIQVGLIKSLKAAKSTAERKGAMQRPANQNIHLNQNEFYQIDLSPRQNENRPTFRVNESRSQFQFPLTQANKTKIDWQAKSRHQAAQSFYQPIKMANHKVNYVQNGGQLLIPQPLMGANHRDRLIQAQVYRQGYQKLKQKYKKQAQNSKNELTKRLALQNNENTLKLEIMRLRLRSDELEKVLNDKTNRIKELQHQISQIQQKESQGLYFKEELSKKEYTIRLLQDTIRSLNREVEELREFSKERDYEEADKLKEIKTQMDAMKIRYETKERELQRELKHRNDLLLQKETDLSNKIDLLEREKRSVQQFERSSQSKLFELEKMLQNQKNASKGRQEEHKSKIQKMQQQAEGFEGERRQFQREVQKLKSSLMKSEYDRRLISQQFDSMKAEFGEMRPFKQKYGQLLREHRAISQEKVHLERQLQRTIQSKEVNLTEINKQFQEQVDYYKRINRDLDEKCKQLSAKMIEVEGQLDLNRNMEEKHRRQAQTLGKELADAKEKEKQAKKALKLKEQELLTIESENAGTRQKVKNIDQIYKMELDKLKEDNAKYRSELENEIEINKDLTDTNSNISMELSKLKIKLQYTEEKLEKETVHLKEKQAQLQNIIKDYDEQIDALSKDISQLRNAERQYTAKIQKYDIQTIRNEEKHEKVKKECKILEEKLSMADAAIKSKSNELGHANKDKEIVEKKLIEVEHELNTIKNENSSTANELKKVNKINQILQEDLRKARSDISNHISAMGERQKEIQELKSMAKLEKEEFTKLQTKLGNFRKEVQRSKESLWEGVNRTIMSLPLGDHMASRNSLNAEGALIQINSKRISEVSFSDILTMITTQNKDIRIHLSKQSESMKAMQKENERLGEEVSMSTNKCQTSEYQLQKKIEALEEEISHLLAEKEEEAMRFEYSLEEMSEKLQNKEAMLQDLNSQYEEMSFTLKSLRLDFEAANEASQNKASRLKTSLYEKECRIEEQIIAQTELEDKIGYLQNDKQSLAVLLENEKDMHAKKDRMLEELKLHIQASEVQRDDLKRSKKELAEKISELQLYVNSERELKEKNKQLLEEEEAKGVELKNFISSLMKQKEASIKNELEKTEIITGLEADILELAKEKEIAEDESRRCLKAIQTHKETIRQLQQAMKEMENDRKEEKVKLNKHLDRMKEKEKELMQKDEALKKLELRNDKMMEKHKGELAELQDELSQKNAVGAEAMRESNEKVLALESQLLKKNGNISALQNKAIELEEEVFSLNEKCLKSEQALGKAKAEVEDLKMKIRQMDINLNDLLEELKEKEEAMFEFKSAIYTLEQRLLSKENEKNERLEELDNDWNDKLNALQQEYNNRIELVEKERDYYMQMIEERERETSKLATQVKNAEISQANFRRVFEEKIRKLEEEKLSLFSMKNSEVQRLLEENKTQLDGIKAKESELRRVTNELEVARKTIANLDQKSKEYDEKIKNINRVYQAELEQLKKKEQGYKLYKENISNSQWNLEREIKKYLQHFVRSFLQINENEGAHNSQKIIDLVKNLENSIMDSLILKNVQ